MSDPIVLSEAEGERAIRALAAVCGFDRAQARNVIETALSAVNDVRRGYEVGTLMRHRDTGYVIEYVCDDDFAGWRAISPKGAAGLPCVGLERDKWVTIYDPSAQAQASASPAREPRRVHALAFEHRESRWRDSSGDVWQWFAESGGVWRFELSGGGWSRDRNRGDQIHGPYTEVIE